jgi:glutaredoxin
MISSKITVYIQKDCPYCRQTLKEIATLIADGDLHVLSDDQHSAASEEKQSYFFIPPVIYINDKLYSSGQFSLADFKEALVDK